MYVLPSGEAIPARNISPKTQSTEDISWYSITPREQACVTLHARPQLIKAARDTHNPLTGFIHLIEDEEDLEVVPHETGSWVTGKTCRTIMAIPIRGDIDLPLDILSVNYINPENMMVPGPH